MANQFVNIPVLAANGAGAPVDVSKMGATKTIVAGDIQGGTTVTIEYSEDPAGVGPWAPLPEGSFQNPGRVTYDFAAHWLRAVTSSYMGGTPNADCGASGDGATFVEVGAGSADISALPALKTVVTSGAGILEVSQDGVSWSQAFAFQNPGGQTQRVYGQFARWTGGGTVWLGGAVSGDDNGYPAFPSPSKLTIIYARQTGSDTSGNGTLANPYRTFQRAVLDLPRQPLPNEFWRVDITDLGSETLPANYAMPVLQAPFGGDLTATFPNPNIPFNTQCAIEVYAAPTLAAVANPQFTCTAVNVDADTGLVEIVTDQSYAGDSLKGLLVQASAPNGLPAIVGVVWHNTAGPNSTIYLSHTYLPDGPPSLLASIFCLPVAGQPGSLRTQSAELLMQTGPFDFVKSGFLLGGCGSVAIRGIKFTQVVPNPVAFGVTAWRCGTVFFEACDLPGFAMLQNGGANFMINNYIHDGLFILQGPVFIMNSYLKGIPSMMTPFAYAGGIEMIGTVTEGCAPIGPRYDPVLPSNRGACSYFSMRNGVVFNAIPDQLLGYIADPTNTPFFSIGAGNAIPGHGIIVRGGSASLDHVKIWGCASSADADGINAEFAPGCTLLRSIRGGTGGIIFGDIFDAPNGRHGVHLDDGAHVIVQDGMPAGNTPKSDITGAMADLYVGTLGNNPWVAVAPSLYDITAVGGGGAKGTGSYIAQKT